MTTLTSASKTKEPLYSGIKSSPVHEHLISALVENRPGVLARISGMFAARGFNIASLAVGATTDSSVSRMTIVCIGDDRVIEQIIKQLRKIIDVIRVVDLREREHVERELMLIKVQSNAQNRSEIMQIVDIFRGRIIDVHHESLMVEISGTLDKNSALIELLEPFGIVELARTGRIALFRGPDALRMPE
ncbi:acetolactate synthase small subunit [Candidatus Sumerlaeota bacterium]|nr:acetolactate synthase small subunit [Candidatus Sumerlaeota bacterium]MBI3736784.1 acetolactate synthase small subunit [Candidatus Sumerlaeota bacterium]